MKHLITEFRRGAIAGISYRSKELDSIAQGAFDAIVLASSWDARSICITKAKNIRTQMGLVMFFQARDSKGLRDRHDSIIREFLNGSSESVKAVSGPSCDVTSIWRQIEDHLVSLRVKLGRPLKLLVDLSTCPRYYAIGIVALSFARRLASHLYVFYAEGAYQEDRTIPGYAFTGGHWSTVAGPYLSGYFQPAKPRHYLVSGGFEGDKTFRAVSRADPDKVSLLLSKPGICAEYEKRSRVANRSLVQEFAIPKNNILYSPASDAIATWKKLADWNRCRGAENMSYLCCGTKPHALGMVLDAVTFEDAAVLYNVPDEHRVHETESNGVFWAYDVRDLSALP
jgi:hypothetical protein